MKKFAAIAAAVACMAISWNAAVNTAQAAQPGAFLNSSAPQVEQLSAWSRIRDSILGREKKPDPPPPPPPHRRPAPPPRHDYRPAPPPPPRHDYRPAPPPPPRHDYRPAPPPDPRHDYRPAPQPGPRHDYRPAPPPRKPAPAPQRDDHRGGEHGGNHRPGPGGPRR